MNLCKHGNNSFGCLKCWDEEETMLEEVQDELDGKPRSVD